MSRIRFAVFTINNPTDNDVQCVKNIKCHSITAGLEKGAKGTPHIQGAIYFDNAKTLVRICKQLGGRAHVERAKGTWQQNIVYTQKDGVVIRAEGSGPAQGKRGDVNSFRDEIRSGATDAMLLDTHANEIAKFPRFISFVRDSMLDFECKVRPMPQGIWIHGPTGVGKSHLAHITLGLNDYYVHSYGKTDWWDNYRQQKVCIFNDFRGEIKYDFLLRLCDKWPIMVNRRSTRPIPFTSQRIVITSCLSPAEAYPNRLEKDSLDQLMRRFDVFEVKSRQQGIDLLGALDAGSLSSTCSTK